MSSGPAGEPVSRAHAAVVAAMVAAVLVSGLAELAWGVPSEERARLAIPGDRAAAIARIARQAEGDRQQKLERSTVIAVPGSTRVPEGGLAADPVALARALRRFLTFSTDWDEPHVIRALSFVRPRQLDFNPRMFMYGTLTIYPVGAFIGIGMLAGWIPRGGLETFLARPDGMGRIYLAGRLYVLLLVCLSIVALWWAARQALAPGTALLAAAVYAASTPLHAWMVLIKPHLPACGFVALAYGFSARAVRTGSRRDLAWAAVASALAASLIPPSGIALLAAVAAAGLVETSLAARLRRWMLQGLLVGAICLVLNPYYLLDWHTFRTEAAYGKDYYPFRPGLAAAASMVRHQVLNALPLPLALLALAGVAALPRKLLLLTLVVPAANMTMAATHLGSDGHPGFIRFLFPSWPFLCLLTAAGFELVQRRSRPLATALLGIGLAWALAHGAFYHRDRLSSVRGPATEISASQWLSREIPRGARIGVQQTPLPAELPPFDLTAYDVRWIPDPARIAADPPEWFITSVDRPPAPGYRRVVAFVEDRGPSLVTGDPIPGRSPEAQTTHRITVAGLSLGNPMQLHQVPVYVFRR